MSHRAATVLCALLVAAPAAGQCTGDIDGNGTVSIADVVAVVNQALGDCGTPTIGCPYPFTQTNGGAGQPYCLFAGMPRDAGCSGPAAEASWLANDGQLILIFPDVYLAATVTGPRSADITAYFYEPDASDARPFRGVASLTSDGAMLHVTPAAGQRGLYVNGCLLSHYGGHFLGVRYDE